MRWLSMALLAMTKIPFEKMFFKRPDPGQQIEQLEAALAKDSKLARELSRPALELSKGEGYRVIDESLPAVQSPGVSNEETIAYQKRELAKELLLLEKHLQQKCKILGKACDCCEKHPLAIEALAQEALGMTGDPVFNEVARWAKEIAPDTTESASASGKFDEQYPQMAVEARELRKMVMGTAEVSALLTPGLSEKVSAELKEIVDRALKGEGGSDVRAEQ